MGERRLRAARAAGLDAVPAIVRDTTDDALLRDALLENIHRVQLNPLEEAAAYQQLLEEFGATHEELASRIGRSRSQVTNTIRLMKLPVKVQTRVAAGRPLRRVTRGRCSGLADAEAQDALATRIVAEGMSVRATEEAVAMAASRAADRQAPGPQHQRARASRSWARGCPTGSRPRSRSRSAGPRARSSSSSVRSTTCSGSSASWRRRSPGAVRTPEPAHPRSGPGFRHRRRVPGSALASRGLSSGPVPARRASSRARTSPSSYPAASTAIGNIEVSVRPGDTFTSRKCTCAVGGDDRVGAGQVGQAEHLVHPDRQRRRPARRRRRSAGPVRGTR